VIVPAFPQQVPCLDLGSAVEKVCASRICVMLILQVPNVHLRKLATGPCGCTCATFSHDGMILAVAASESSTLDKNVFKIILYR